MKRSTVLTALLALAPCAPSRLFAQTADHPNLIVTIQGGIITGGDLWSLPRQTLPGAFPPGSRDTVALGRRLRSGVVALASGTYFTSPHLGYYGEIGYFGMGGEGACSGVGTFKADSSPSGEVPPPNQKACEGVNGASFATSLVAFQAGVVYRFAPTSDVSPYLRFTAGVGALGNSFVEESALINSPGACSAFTPPQCTYTILDDPKRPSFTWVTTLAVGNTFRISPGYNARFEVRDLITSLPFAADSGTSVAGAPTARVGWKLHHAIGLTLGLDIILERSHRRRY